MESVHFCAFGLAKIEGIFMKKVLSIVFTLSLFLISNLASASKLIDAASWGNIAEVKSLIKAGADVNGELFDGWTALMAASFIGYQDIAALLIENGAEVNKAKNTSGWTPLIMASRVGHKEIAALLIENGANTNAKDVFGWTALMWAADNGHQEIVALLIKNKAHIDAKNDNGFTATTLAYKRGQTEVLKLLSGSSPRVSACTTVLKN